jgi:peptide chain release factor subunit 1
MMSMASQIPTTTHPGPDQAELQALIRRLAEAEPGDAPILSVYLDVRPEAHGEAPGRRPEVVIVRDRLREIGDSEPHAPARASIDADAEKILGLVTDAKFDGVDGVAVFACHEIGLWEELRAPVAFDTQVSAGTHADLFQAARLLADSEPAVVALVDTNTCRLFVTRFGALVERSGRGEPPDEHRRHEQGGWSQAHYQRHIDMQDKRFAGEAATAIGQLVDGVNARHVILAGDERGLKVLQPELSPRVAAMVERVVRVGMRAGSDEVAEVVEPLLAAFRQAAEAEAADRVVAGVRAGELGVAGIDTVAAALEAGQVHELVLDRAAAIDEAQRAELVRQAALTSASVVVVDGHERLMQLGGVGATLRYRINATR